MISVDRKTLRLSPGQFVDEVCEKTLLVIHHTVGATAKSTFDYWEEDPRRVATAYIIDRDGTIYETFDPTKWAYHVAVKGAGSDLEKRSVGIELASEGGLIESDGKFYCFDRVSQRTLHTADKVILPVPWRGYHAFDAYEPEQTASLFELVTSLMAQFPRIPRRISRPGDDGLPRFLPPTWSGVCGHANMRGDKSDPHPMFPWPALAAATGLVIA